MYGVSFYKVKQLFYRKKKLTNLLEETHSNCRLTAQCDFD